MDASIYTQNCLGAWCNSNKSCITDFQMKGSLPPPQELGQPITVLPFPGQPTQDLS